MKPRIIEFNDINVAKKEMFALGCCPDGIKIMAPKAISFAIKVYGITPTAANIIKQEMLSYGGEAATAYGAINHSVKITDVLIIGSLKQFELLIDKLQKHQFGLPKVGEEIQNALKNYTEPKKAIKIGEKVFHLGKRTYIMGIVNVTPDSFFDGGKFFGADKAVEQAEVMLEEGADILDIGGESTRPGAKTVSLKEELGRVVPVIKKVLKNNKKAIISIDTRKSAVARAALDAGASMVNDVSGLRFDPKMAKVAAEYKAAVCIMHCKGEPKNMQADPKYSDLMGEINAFFDAGLAIAKNAGILLEKIILDPGLGFGKTVEHNLEIFRKLKELKVFGCPVLIGPSRKAFIGKTLDLPVSERLEGTYACIAHSIVSGVDFIRVHDIKGNARVVKMIDAIVRRN
ncbi:MAG: dihydropteroate synthase [Candidatus Margulisiibacteriota bacterium]